MQCDKFLYKLPFFILKYLPVREKTEWKVPEERETREKRERVRNRVGSRVNPYCSTREFTKESKEEIWEKTIKQKKRKKSCHLPCRFSWLWF